MAEFFHCFACRKVTPLLGSGEKRCPSCASANGEVIPGQRVTEGLEAGVFFNIDPRTGERAKKKKR